MKGFIAFFVLFSLNSFGQTTHLHIKGATPIENKIIDSLTYNKIHNSTASIINEINLMSSKLSKIGYLENHFTENQKIVDTLVSYTFSINTKTNFIHIYIGEAKKYIDFSFYQPKNDSIKIPFTDSENFILKTLNKLEKEGFAMAKVRFTDFKKQNQKLCTNLELKLDKKRLVNTIIINGYDKFPSSFKKNIVRLYKNKIFTQEKLEKVNTTFNQYPFIKQTRYPEILFTKDSTKVFVYLEKKSSNSFDGFIGFSNNESKNIVFTGYLDLSLNNILNSGEKFILNWKNQGNNQKTFNIGIEMPYAFKSPVGIKAQLNIFTQDSTFQTTKTNFDLGYFFNYNSRCYLGYQSSESSDIQNTNSVLLNDFTNRFFTSSYDFFQYKTDDFLFPEKTSMQLKIGTGERKSKFDTNTQFFGSLNLSHNFYFNTKNSLNIKTHNYYLKSNSYIVNELYRFGGINSIRGFNENSLQASFFSALLTEYRYTITPSIYIHSIIDYGYYQDKTINSSNSLLSTGFGFGLLSKNGLFRLIYANGNTKEQAIKLSNSILHISLKTTF